MSEVPRGRRDVLSVGAGLPREPRQAVDLVAHSESCDAEANCVDHAGDVPTQDDGQGAEQPSDTVARAGLPVDRVDAGYRDTDPDLGRWWLGHWAFLDDQDIGSTELVLGHDPHGVLLRHRLPLFNSFAVGSRNPRLGGSSHAGTEALHLVG